MAGEKSSNVDDDDEQLAISEGLPSKTALLSLTLVLWSSRSELRRNSSLFSEKILLLLLESWKRDSDELDTPKFESSGNFA